MLALVLEYCDWSLPIFGSFGYVSIVGSQWEWIGSGLVHKVWTFSGHSDYSTFVLEETWWQA